MGELIELAEKLVDKVPLPAADQWAVIWTAMKAAWFLIALYTVAVGLVGMYWARLIDADPTAYWRLSNDRLRDKVTVVTSRMRSTVAKFDSYIAKNQLPIAELNFSVQQDYNNMYRDETIALRRAIEPRLPKRIRLVYEVTRLDHFKAVTKDLQNIGDALPRHRPLGLWLKAVFLPS